MMTWLTMITQMTIITQLSLIMILQECSEILLSQQSALEILANLCTVGEDGEEWEDEASEDEDDFADSEDGKDEGEKDWDLLCEESEV